MLPMLTMALVSAAPTLQPVSRGDLCVTKGRVETGREPHLLVSVPEMRAVLRRRTPPSASVAFTYRGPSRETKALGSGTVRRQIGLKLRAENGCNLVYAVWRIAPKAELVVSVKRNPGQSTHAQCGTRGYRNVRPQASERLPQLAPGEAHALRADLDGTQLSVGVDGHQVWSGDLGGEVLQFDGPVGIRTDNAAFDFILEAYGSTGAPESPATCHEEPDDE
jgi:hypothetical protein